MSLEEGNEMKKRMLVLTMVLLMIMSVMPMAAQAEYVQTLYSGGALNLRQGPGKDYGVEGYVKDGDQITLTGDSDIDAEGYTWVEVEVARTNQIGFIKDIYVVNDWTASLVPNKSIHIPNGTAIIVRGGPGTGYSIKGYVYEGDRVSILSHGSVWCKVRLEKNDVVGYIKNKYIYGYNGMTSGTVSPDTGYYATASVTTKYPGSAVNLRTGPGSGYLVVTQLYRGNALTITGKSGNWYQVTTSNGYVGYIYKDYVSAAAGAYVTAGVNLRTGPGMSYSRHLVIPKGSSVTILGYSGNWVQVSYAGYVGYVYTTYVAR